MKRTRRPTKSKPWTVLVYLAGDNDLAAEMVWALAELKAAAERRAVRDGMNLLAEIDVAGSPPRRYELTGAGASDSGDLPALGRPAPSPAKNELPLERFLSDAIRELPAAKRSAIVLSGHGSGAVGDFLPDLEPRSAVSIPRLGRILARTRSRLKEKIGLLGLDSCQMSTVETAFEVRGSVRFLVASEGTVLNAGWPYQSVLDAFLRAKSEEGAARAVVRRYLRYYRDYELASQSTDVAVCDLERLDAVVEALRAFAEAMLRPLARLAPDGLEEGVELGALARKEETPGLERARALRDAIVLAHWSAQSYKRDREVDLADFADQIARYARRLAGAGAAPLVDRAERLSRAIDRAVLASGTTGPDFQHSRGLSIYFPWSSNDYDEAYGNLALAKRSGWARFVRAYLERTRRMRRGQARHLTSQAPLAAEEPFGVRHAARAGIAAAKDPDSGTHRDADAGTHRGERCPATTKNPPRGYYREPE